jgi:two-component system, cell cycle sensor histidine kinase and response regulator CckA
MKKDNRPPRRPRYAPNRKRAVDAPPEVEMRLNELLERAQVTVFRWEMTPSVCVSYVSASVTKLLGYAPEEFYADPELSFRVVHPEDPGILEPLVTGEMPLQPRTVRYLHRDGHVVWVEQAIMPIHDAAGELVAIEGIARDITERKEAEDALLRSEERFRSIFDNAAVGVIVVDSACHITMANQVASRFLGYTCEELAGMHYAEITQPDDLSEEGRRRQVHKALIDAGGSSCTSEKCYVRKDGQRVWAKMSLSVARDDQGAPSYFVAVVEDESQRHEAEEALKEANRMLNAVIQSSPLAITVLDRDMSIRMWNPAAEAMFGWTAEEVIGRCLLAVPEERLPETLALYLRVLQGHTMTDVDTRRTRRDGSIIDVSLSLAPVPDATDQVAGAVAMYRDITEPKRLRRELLRAQRLETAGRIAGQVAHDFNNLLSPLAAYRERMKLELPEGHPALHYCDTMIEAANRMADINTDMLTLGRRGHIEREQVHLNKLILDVVSQITDRPDTLLVDLRLAPELRPISGSPAQLVRMLLNLIANARDAMQDSGALTIKTENLRVNSPAGRNGEIEVGEYVRVTVSDTGSGITAEIRDKVFEPFFTTKRADEKRGTGLGMSVVQAVVEDHHGHLDLKSDVGKGSSFSAYFPRSREEAASAPQETVPGGSESILLVDDDPIQREVARAVLIKLGYHVEVARSGEEAVSYLKKRSADLLILDMVMPPGMDGAETYAQVMKFKPGQRAIILSGFAETERVEVAKALGAGSHILKPISTGKLAKAVRLELDRRLP